MSLMDAPLAAIDRVLRRAPTPSPDDPVVRHIERVAGSLEPAHRFRGRLRGIVLNHYVAEVEGLMRRQAPRRQMGGLGRAVLYASFSLAVGVGSAGAASQVSLPGDLLYPVKVQVEELRMRVAPEGARPHLLALELAERLAELEALADAGRWHLVPAAADRVAEVGAELEATGLAPSGVDAQLIEHRLEVLGEVLALAPEAARRGLQRAISSGEAATGAAGEGPGGEHATPTSSGGGSRSETPGGGADSAPGRDRDPDATPVPTPKERPTLRPQSTPPPTATPTPEATPVAESEEIDDGDGDATESGATPTSGPTPKPRPSQGQGQHTSP